MDATKKITKNLGGDRLGSGNKNNIEMHAYNRSTHDLSYAWRSSMNVGTLVPFMMIPILPGDTFSIDLETLVRTVPAIGPLYGSYKLQLDIFECPIRLYNGLLHNNMQKIGLNMAQVKMPTMTLAHKIFNPTQYQYTINGSQIATDSLLNYLGLSGIGDIDILYKTGGNKYVEIEREFNAVPVLAYWDIYKNYYTNKQEEKGYFIKPLTSKDNSQCTKISKTYIPSHSLIVPTDTYRETPLKDNRISQIPQGITIDVDDIYQEAESKVYIENNFKYDLYVPKIFDITTLSLIIEATNGTTTNRAAVPFAQLFQNWDFDENENILHLGYPKYDSSSSTTISRYILGIEFKITDSYRGLIDLEEVRLEDLDQTRIEILKATGLNNKLSLNNLNYEPFTTITGTDPIGQNLNKYTQCGLAIKTYQSDLYNNWLETEWIDGENGINQITAIDTSSGSFTIDALNLANKVYNMLNRIAVSGGSYEDYIEAVYTVETLRRAESPIYKGGLSAEIVFEEVVSTAQTDQDPLGTLAGKGTQTGKRGGHIEIKTDEPGVIIGIASITPRIDYSQGNKWFITEIYSVDDLHKPALDGIGFQDLLQERMAWWGTYFSDETGWTKLAAGKVPAWIDYMSAVNETHGDFAADNKCMYMTLNRRYEYPAKKSSETESNGIQDLTTYINPTKYNYSFADISLTAQNFWVQIGCKVTARRVMSAKMIPNL